MMLSRGINDQIIGCGGRFDGDGVLYARIWVEEDTLMMFETMSRASLVVSIRSQQPLATQPSFAHLRNPAGGFIVKQETSSYRLKSTHAQTRRNKDSSFCILHSSSHLLLLPNARSGSINCNSRSPSCNDLFIRNTNPH